MHFDPHNPSLTSHDFVKAIYRTQLDFLADEAIISFWNAHPLRLGGVGFDTRKTLELLWSGKTMVPMAWDYAVGESLERTLVENGISIFDFYGKMLNRNNRSTFQPGRLILKWFYPFIRKYFNADPRDMVINLIPHWTENAYPLHVHRRVKRVERGEWVESVMVYITDRTFRETIYFDLEIQGGLQVKAGPKRLRVSRHSKSSESSRIAVAWNRCYGMRNWRWRDPPSPSTG